MLVFSSQHVSLFLLVFVKTIEGQEEISQDNFIGLVNALVEKVGGLEGNLEEIKESTNQETLIETVNALAEKVGDLQGEIEEKLKELEEEIDKKKNGLGLGADIMEKVRGIEIEMKELKRENIFLKTKGAKTCSELKANGFDKSGIYEIDPNYSGSTIEVYCDMLTGTTEVNHNVIDSIEIGYCEGDGCFEKEYKYSAPQDQIEALISRSSTCEQEMKYDCNIAPLKNNMFGFYYGWWVDRNGQKKFYFDGADEDLHVCGCYPNCQASVYNNTCNCDASLIPWWSVDSGKITNKDHLPIKSFSYGGFISNQQQAKIKVGPLKCTGIASSSSGLMSSCSSLKEEGSSVSGFYLTKPIQEADLQVSYCRMDQDGYKEDDLRVGEVMDIQPRTKMVKLGVVSYLFQTGANFSSTWKDIRLLQVDSATIMKDLNQIGVELDLELGTLTFRQSGVYVFINVKVSPTNTAWQLGTGYNGRYNFEKVYYIEKDKKISLTGHGNVKSFELGIIPLYQMSF